MITNGEQQTQSYENVNERLLKIPGYLEDEEARTTLGEFLRYNIKFFIFILTGFRTEGYQMVMIKGWLKKNFSLCVASRGSAKSTMAGIFSIIYCLLNPGKHVILISVNFRSSRGIVEKIEAWAKRKQGVLLRQCIDVPIKGGLVMKRPDQFRVKFKNGSSITALPLGDSNNLRGFRCNVLVIDEGLLIPQATIDNVLKPFLFASGDIEESQKIIERESRLIALGRMKESERTKLRPNAKMIILSSASYRWEHLYTIYESYLKKIFGQEKDEDKKNLRDEEKEATYLVQQMSYEIIPEHILDKGMLDDLKNGIVPQSVIDREYKSKFTQDSDGYFKASKMEECTIPNGMDPTIEIRGDKDAEYVLAIDPNVASGDAADHFAMCLMKILKKPDSDKKIGMVVHQYAVAGVDLKHHMMYLLYVLKYFNVVYIACDTTQGDMADFISSCNESQLFKDAKIELHPLEADFGKNNADEIKKEIRQSYNKEAKRIVQKQYFHAAYIKAANEHLQGCIDFKNIIFAAKGMANDRARERMSHQGITKIYTTHPEWCEEDLMKNRKEAGEEEEKTADIYSFILSQDNWMDLVKKECALIEHRRNAYSESFELPTAMTKNRKNPNRVRRDSYTALCLCNWALKLYVESMELPTDEGYELPMPALV